MGAYSNLDVLVDEDIAARLIAAVARSRRAAAVWRRLPGQTWRAERCTERASRLIVLVDLVRDGLLAGFDAAAASLLAAIADMPDQPGEFLMTPAELLARVRELAAAEDQREQFSLWLDAGADALIAELAEGTEGPAS